MSRLNFVCGAVTASLLLLMSVSFAKKAPPQPNVRTEPCRDGFGDLVLPGFVGLDKMYDIEVSTIAVDGWTGTINALGIYGFECDASTSYVYVPLNNGEPKCIDNKSGLSQETASNWMFQNQAYGSYYWMGCAYEFADEYQSGDYIGGYDS